MTLTPARVAIVGLALTCAATLTPLSTTSVAALSDGTVPAVARATDSNGAQYPTGTTAGAVSADGRWLGFSRPEGGTYVKDLLSGSIELVSLNAAGTSANTASTMVAVSGNGAKVLFSTAASNMPGGPATSADLYVRDRTYGTTTRVNYLPGSSSPTAVVLGQGAMDDAGFTVVFTTAGANHVYRRTLNPAATEQVDVSSQEIPGGGSAHQPAVSATGRYITFTSTSTTLVAGDTNSVADIFERDTLQGTTVRASLPDNGQADQPSSWSSVSSDGSQVAFMSYADNLSYGDVNVSPDVFVRNVKTASTYLVSQASDGTKGNGTSGYPDISADGRYVAFQSSASTFEPSPNNNSSDVFRRDLQEGYTVRVGDINAPNSVPNGASWTPSITADGAGIAFGSGASNLVGPGEDTNGSVDTFIARLEVLGPWAYYSDFVHEMIEACDAAPATEAPTLALVRYGKVTPTHLVSTLAHQPAWALHREPVARLYQSFFLRRPDANGLAYWAKKHAAGIRLSKIAASFAGSSEFKNTYGKLDNTDFVTLVYGNVLQRKPDPNGLAHWVKKLAAGTSRGDIMVAFSESSEGKRFLAPWVDATLVGLALFHGKIPDQATYDQAVAARWSTGVPEGTVLSYLTSNAYAAAKATF